MQSGQKTSVCGIKHASPGNSILFSFRSEDTKAFQHINRSLSLIPERRDAEINLHQETEQESVEKEKKLTR